MHVNNDYQRNSNISKIFQDIWNNPEISRVDIAKRNELYRSTVTNIINTLISNELIIEGDLGAANIKGGRKPVSLSVNKNYGCIIGIELQIKYYRVVVINMCGEIIFSTEGKTLRIKDSLIPEENFKTIINNILDTIFDNIKKIKNPPLCVCVGLPGIVNIDEGIIIESKDFGLINYNYAEKIGRKFGIPFFFENEAYCIGWLQISDEKKENDDNFCIYTKPSLDNCGIDVALSLTMKGKIIRGSNYRKGTYISNSWSRLRKGQTGLPEAVYETVLKNHDSYVAWIEDLFRTLTSFIPLLAPNSIYLYGQSDDNAKIIRQIIHEKIPQFEDIVGKFNSKFIIVRNNHFIVARGAALMFLQEMMNIPDIENIHSYSRLDWDDLFYIRDISLRSELFLSDRNNRF